MGVDFRGVLYAGLMVSKDQFNVLEFNVRFGDPETQAILPRMQSDLLPLLLAAAEGNLKGIKLEWKDGPAVCVVLASGGYPGEYATGFPIEGLDKISEAAYDQVAVFHAGTALRDGRIVTAGGRVLGVTAWGGDLPQTLDRVYGAADKISYNGCYYRRDIAHKALR